MQNVPSPLVAGLYITQQMLRFQVSEAKSEITADQQREFDHSMETGDFSLIASQTLYKAFSRTIELLTDQFGVLQATKLTRGLFQPAVLKVVIEHLMLHTDSVDWDEVGQEVPRVIERFKMGHLFTPPQKTWLGTSSGLQVREVMQRLLQPLMHAGYDYPNSSDADYRYASIWSGYFSNAQTLQKTLYSIGVRRRDDDRSPTAVANLLGTESGEFEAFCILHSLGPKAAEQWERERVEYGHEEYAGAVARAMQYVEPDDRSSFFASAFAAGYPVQDPKVENDDFSELIGQIPGGIADTEQLLLNDLVYAVALDLYHTLTHEQYAKPQRWRGYALTSDYHHMREILDDRAGAAAWLPAVKLRVDAYANQYFHKDNSGSEEHNCLLDKARKFTTQHPSARRVIYLIDQLCIIIEDDFKRLGLVK